MKKFLIALVLVLTSLAAMPVRAEGNAADLAAFKKTLAAVQAAVAQNSPEKVADLSKFPKFYWEDGLADDVTRDAFLKSYQKMFTPEIKAKLAAGKYHAVNNGDYAIEWTRGHSDYVLVFERQSDGTYKFAGLAVGPAD